jgi:transcriptional regulator with XRE-family HTH domain
MRTGRARSPWLKRQDLAAEIGARIAENRLARRWRQVDLAARAGLLVPRLSRLENGHNVPNVHELVRLREALGLSIDELVLGKTATREGLRGLVGRLHGIASADELREAERLLEAWIEGLRSKKEEPT